MECRDKFLLMKSLFIFLFMLCSTGLFAYQPDEDWYPGQVKLVDGTQLIGDIHYNLGFQTAKIRINGQTTSLKENQLASMVIFTEKLRHEFQQVALRNEQGEVASSFAKMIYRSRKKFSLYKEYFAVTEEVDISPTTGMPSIKEQPADLKEDAFMPNPKLGISMDYRFFLANSEGISHPISAKGFSEAYGQCYEKIKGFIFRNRLTVRKEADLVRIIRYADSLVGGCPND